MEVLQSLQHDGAWMCKGRKDRTNPSKVWRHKLSHPPPYLRGTMDRVFSPHPWSNEQLCCSQGTTYTIPPLKMKLHGTRALKFKKSMFGGIKNPSHSIWFESEERRVRRWKVLHVEWPAKPKDLRKRKRR